MVLAASALTIAATATAMAWAGPAGATIDRPNTIGCSGQAVITETNGKIVTIEATQATAHIPRKASKPVTYTGSVTKVTHDHHGFVAVELGPFKIHFYSWGPSQNAKNKTSDSGARAYPKIMKSVPPGEYHVTGEHGGTEGSCRGSMTIIVDGSPLSNVAGIVALVGTIVFGLLFLLSLLGHPVAGVIGGLLLGVFALADLMLWSVAYPTTILLIALPVAGIVVGLLLGLWGPIGGTAP